MKKKNDIEYEIHSGTLDASALARKKVSRVHSWKTRDAISELQNFEGAEKGGKTPPLLPPQCAPYVFPPRHKTVRQ